MKVNQININLIAWTCHLYGLAKWNEVQIILKNKNQDHEKHQKNSMIFFQAQEDIHHDIFIRREQMIAENVLDEKEMEEYYNLKNRYYKSVEKPPYRSR